MNVTVFGTAFLVVTLFVFLFRREWLLSLVCVAAVLQSPSVLDVTLGGVRYGVTPFVVVAALICIDLVRRVRRYGFVTADAAERPVLQLWLAFAALSLLSALVLPWMFAGEPVFSPLDKNGAHTATTALTWSMSNLAQQINTVLIFGLLLWLLQHRRDPRLPTRMLVGVVVAVAVSAAIGLQQRLAWNGLLPLWETFWASNPTYAQNYQTWAGPVPRVSWPFVEASYGSAWFAAAFGGFISMYFADLHRHKALFGAMVALFALGNSLGATGMLAASAFCVLVLAVAGATMIGHPGARGGIAYRLSLGALVGACVGLAVFLVLRRYALLDETALALGNVLQGRNQTVLGDLRPHADMQALRLLWDTWGIGAGMGSNRGSSYLATLASTTGIVGVVLFCVAFGWQLRLLIVRLLQAPTAPAMFFLGSGIAGLIAVAIAIPDQNWPVFWILVSGGFACVIAERGSGGATRDAPQPARHREADDGAIQPYVDQAERQR